MAEHCIVMTTAASRSEAERLARAVVEDRLAACVQMLAIGSVYRWEGEVTDADEVLLLVKTRTELYAALEAKIAELHTYEVPEIIQVPIDAGFAAYLGWVDGVT